MRRTLLLVVAPTLALPLLCLPAKAGDNRNFTVPLSGDNEVPPRDTQARGVAIFHVSKDGTSVEYKLIVANIENLVAAHIHVGSPAVNGPVVVSLFGPAAAGGGRVQGPVSEGTFTAANLVGPLTGAPLSALLAVMDTGNTYVNAHTNDGVAPPNTGPGDFPGGEIRGQIKP